VYWREQLARHFGSSLGVEHLFPEHAVSWRMPAYHSTGACCLLASLLIVSTVVPSSSSSFLVHPVVVVVPRQEQTSRMKSTAAAAATLSPLDDDTPVNGRSRMVAAMISSLDELDSGGGNKAVLKSSSTNDNTMRQQQQQQEKKNTSTKRGNRRRLHHHLVLHFDINETILVGDEAGGDSREDCINKMLAKSAFVRMTPTTTTGRSSTSTTTTTSATTTTPTTTTTPLDSSMDHCSYECTANMEPTLWWDGTPIKATAQSQSQSPSPPLPLPPPPLYTGWQWPPGCCPYYRTKYKNRSTTFTHDTASDGAMYRPTYDWIDEKLQTLQQHIVETAAAASKTTTLSAFQQANAPGRTTPVLSTMSEPGPVSADTLDVLSHMLPSFFETLVQLSREFDDDTKNGHGHRKLTLVFRTMGTDLYKIARAMNAFAQGQHPDYPNFYNPHWILTDNQMVQGRWKEQQDITSTLTTTTVSATTTTTRDNDTEDTTETTTSVPNVVYQLFKYKDDDDSHHNDNNSNDDLQRIASGDVEVLDFIHSHTICGIQDDYPFWKRHGQEPFAGKPVWKIVRDDKNDPTTPLSSSAAAVSNHHDDNDLVQHILLDDNIHNLPHDSIASVRQVVLGGMTTVEVDAASTCCYNNGKVQEEEEESEIIGKTTKHKKRCIILGVESLTGSEIQAQHGLHLIRVPTVAPLLDSTWFMTQIRQAQERFADLYYNDDDDYDIDDDAE
jgi:hypothetical protein